MLHFIVKNHRLASMLHTYQLRNIAKYKMLTRYDEPKVLGKIELIHTGCDYKDYVSIR